MTEQRPLPLAGVRVLDLTRFLSGPYCTMILADLGAEVIKVEPIKDGDETRLNPPYASGEVSHYFLSINRGKRSLSLDIKQPQGLAIVKQLIGKCDVLVENFRPGVLAAIGLDDELIHQLNPGTVICSISGFGAGSTEPAFDATVQALSGLMAINGAPGGAPMRLGVPLSDMSGGIWGAIGTLAALAERRHTGLGRRVETNMLHSSVSLLAYLGQMYLVSGEPPQPVGNHHHHIVPYGTYQTSDGYIVIAPYNDRFFRGWCAAAERPELPDDPRFADIRSRKQHIEVLQPIATSVMRSKTTAEWAQRFGREGIPFAEVRSVDQVLDAVRADGWTRPVRLPDGSYSEVVASPVRYDGHLDVDPIRSAAVGEDTGSVLTDLLGMDPASVDQLRADGVVW